MSEFNRRRFLEGSAGVAASVVWACTAGVQMAAVLPKAAVAATPAEPSRKRRRLNSLIDVSLWLREESETVKLPAQQEDSWSQAASRRPEPASNKCARLASGCR